MIQMNVQANAGDTEERFGRYRILSPLAEGGMAQVHLAVKDGAESICVLKRLRLAVSDNAVTSLRFEREANLIAQLSHPNIAQVTDAGRENNCFYIAMEYIAGKDVEAMMHTLMDGGRMMPYVASIYIGLQTLKALAYAHDATDAFGKTLDLVHRDLSPRNIMISYDGEIKVIDFGLARGKIDDFKTAPGMLMGTLRYISPEQALAIGVDARSDLYTISVLLWEMLTGRFLVEAEKTTDILKQVVHEVPLPVSEFNSNLPRELDAVIKKGLAKELEDRWGSAQEYYDALYEAAGALTRLDIKDMGLFARQLFPHDYAQVQNQSAQFRSESVEAIEKTVAQEVIMPTRTSFVIPKRPLPSTPSASAALPQSLEDFVAGPQQARLPSARQCITWVLCLAILGSAAYIGTRFLEQVVKSSPPPSEKILVSPTPSNTIRAVQRKSADLPSPALKAPRLRPVIPTKNKALPTKKTGSKSKPSVPSLKQLSALQRLRIQALALEAHAFDEMKWTKVLDGIKTQSQKLRTQGEIRRINRLARKGMAFQKPQYFLRAIDELERVQ
jgi:serine/threonine protein kinase